VAVSRCVTRAFPHAGFTAVIRPQRAPTRHDRVNRETPMGSSALVTTSMAEVRTGLDAGNQGCRPGLRTPRRRGVTPLGRGPRRGVRRVSACEGTPGRPITSNAGPCTAPKTRSPPISPNWLPSSGAGAARRAGRARAPTAHPVLVREATAGARRRFGSDRGPERACVLPGRPRTATLSRGPCPGAPRRRVGPPSGRSGLPIRPSRPARQQKNTYATRNKSPRTTTAILPSQNRR